MYLIHFTTSGTNEEDCLENWRARQRLQYCSFQKKIVAITTPKFWDIASEVFVYGSSVISIVFLCSEVAGSTPDLSQHVKNITFLFVRWYQQYQNSNDDKFLRYAVHKYSITLRGKRTSLVSIEHRTVQWENLCAREKNYREWVERTPPHLKYALTDNALPAQNKLAAHVAGSHSRTTILQMKTYRPGAPGRATNNRLCALVEARHAQCSGE